MYTGTSRSNVVSVRAHFGDSKETTSQSVLFIFEMFKDTFGRFESRSLNFAILRR